MSRANETSCEPFLLGCDGLMIARAFGAPLAKRWPKRSTNRTRCDRGERSGFVRTRRKGPPLNLTTIEIPAGRRSRRAIYARQRVVVSAILSVLQHSGCL